MIVNKSDSTYNWALESKSFYSSDKGHWLTGDVKQYWKEELDVEISSQGCYKVLPDENKLILGNGKRLSYDKLLIATGCAP